MNSTYYAAQTDALYTTTTLPEGTLPFAQAMERVLPPQISDLHMSLARWKQFDLSPGVMQPDRIWVDPTGEIYFEFRGASTPKPLMQTGLAVEVAAWLVLLDRWMETFVVIARARSVWAPDELAGALSFLTPAFLPPAVVQINPNWAQVAEAVALAVADGPLAGAPSDKHWKSDQKAGQEAGQKSDLGATQVESPRPSWRSIFQRKPG